MPDPTDRGALHQPHTDPDPYERHRLVVCAAGNSGNVGNVPGDPDVDVPEGRLSPEEMLATLWHVPQELSRRSAEGNTPEEVRAWVLRATAMRRRVVDLADAYEMGLQEENAEAADPGGGGPLGWTVLKALAIRHRKSLAGVVGKLLVKSFDRTLESLVQESGDSRPSAPDSAQRPRPER